MSREIPVSPPAPSPPGAPNPPAARRERRGPAEGPLPGSAPWTLLPTPRSGRAPPAPPVARPDRVRGGPEAAFYPHCARRERAPVGGRSQRGQPAARPAEGAACGDSGAGAGVGMGPRSSQRWPGLCDGRPCLGALREHRGHRSVLPAPVPPGPVRTGVEMGRGPGGWTGENEVPAMQTCRCPGRSRGAHWRRPGAHGTRAVYGLRGRKTVRCLNILRYSLC